MKNKKIRILFIVFVLLLTAVSGAFVHTKMEYAEMQEDIDDSFQIAYSNLVRNMRMLQQVETEESRQTYRIQDNVYGTMLRATMFSTSYSKESKNPQDFYKICDYLDHCTGTSPGYNLEFSEELYTSLQKLLECNFEDQELLESTRMLFQKLIQEQNDTYF